jgi:hypothetical protein
MSVPVHVQLICWFEAFVVVAGGALIKEAGDAGHPPPVLAVCTAAIGHDFRSGDVAGFAGKQEADKGKHAAFRSSVHGKSSPRRASH